MAVKTFMVASGNSGTLGALVDGVDQAAATRTDGWIVAKLAAANMAYFSAGNKLASVNFSTVLQPATQTPTTEAFKTPAPLTGTFAATSWTFTFAVRAVTAASAQRGRMRMRVYKGTNATGSNAFEITSAVQIGTTSAALSTTADVTSVITWSPGATVIMANEYLFFSIAWEITTASGSNSGDVLIRTGQAAGGSRVVTPDLSVGFGALGRRAAATTVRGITVTEQFPMLSLLDDFTRANAALGSPNWLGSWWPGYAALQVVSNQAKSVSGVGSSTWGQQFFPDQEIWMDVPTRGTDEIVLYVRAGSLGQTDFIGYELSIAGSTWQLYQTVAGGASLTAIGGAATQTIANGGSIGMSARGNVIKTYYKPPAGSWQIVQTQVDSTLASQVGYVGVEIDGTTTIIDNFGGGGTPLATPIVIGRATPTTVVRGATLSGTGTAAPVVIGRESTATVVRGATLSGTGIAPITIGRVAGGISYVTQILTDGPTGYWRMDESGLPQDSSPTGNHMTSHIRTVAQVTSLLTTEPGLKARGFVAAGGGSFLNRSGLLYPLNTFTIEAWVKLTATGSQQTLFCQYNGGIRLDLDVAGTISLIRSFTGYCATSSALKILDTNTHHVVVTRNGIGGAVVFYLDGVSETPTPAQPNYDFSTGATNGLFIGSEWGNSPLDGTLDEVAIYPLVLSPAQVAAHYNNGSTVSGTSVVRGVTFALPPLTPSVGKIAAITVAHGVTLSGTGTATPVVIGKRSAASPVRGLTLTGAGTVNVIIGRKAAATTARGVTLVGAGVAPLLIGKKLASTTVRGTTVVAAGAALITIGKRVAATTVRGTTLTPVGAAPIVLGARASTTVVRGATVVLPAATIPIGRVFGTGTPILPVTSGLTVQVDASTLTPGALSVWPNLGSGGTGAVVGTPAPNVVAGVLNGLPVVRFTASEGRVRGTGMVVDGSFDLSVLYIARMRGPAVGRIFTNAYPPFNFLVGAHTSLDEWLYDNGAVGGIAWSVPTAWKMYECVSSQVPMESRLFINGVDKGAWTGSAGHDDQWNLSGYAATEETCDCDVAELVCYDRPLTPAERISVENYLQGKWITGGGGAGGTTVRGISFTAGALTTPIGKRAAATTARGVMFNVTGDVPFTVGKRIALNTVRGITLVTGVASIPVGRRVASSSTFGVTLVPAGLAPIAVGKRLAATTARGVTLSAVGTVPLTVGKRAASTTVRGITLAAVGTVPIVVGKRAASTTVRGIALAAQGTLLQIGRVAGSVVSTLPVTSGLGVRLDASQLGLTDGTTITTWPDLSGAGRHLIVSLGTGPTFETNELNGLPVARFNGVSDTIGGIDTPPGDYRHFFVVAKYDLAIFANYNGLISFYGGDLVLVGSGGGDVFYSYIQDEYRWNGVVGPMRPAPMGVWGQMSVAKTAGYLNQRLWLGTDRGFADRYWDGDIAEVIGYDRVLSDSERIQVENYLNTKWFVPSTAAGTGVVRGVGLTTSGTAPISVGKRLVSTAVRGLTLAPGPVTVTVGKRTAATTVRGMTVAPGVVSVPVGRRAAATTVRGLSIVPGTAPLNVGRRVPATTVRGITFVATGVAFVPIGKRGAAAVVSGILLVPGTATLYVGRCVALATVHGLVLIEESTLISDRKLYPGKIVHSHYGRTKLMGNSEAIQLPLGKARIAVGDRGDIEMGERENA